jgi:hypothetical protein
VSDLANFTDFERLAQEIPQLRRGRVWCTSCGCSRQVDSVDCLRHGWPKCCGYTMTIDSPEERKARQAIESREG